MSIFFLAGFACQRSADETISSKLRVAFATLTYFTHTLRPFVAQQKRIKIGGPLFFVQNVSSNLANFWT